MTLSSILQLYVKYIFHICLYIQEYYEEADTEPGEGEQAPISSDGYVRRMSTGSYSLSLPSISIMIALICRSVGVAWRVSLIFTTKW